MKGKIVVTGYGVKAPNTNDIAEYIDNLKNGICCLETVTDLSPNGETTIIGHLKGGLEEFESNKRFKRLPRATLLGIASGKEALKQAKLSDLTDKKVGIFFGISVGAIGEKLFHDSIIHVNENNYRNVPITFSHFSNYHSITAEIAHNLSIKGITKTITTGCTSSLEAIQDAMLYLKSGIIDVAVVGGADSLVNKMACFGFAKTKSIPINQTLDVGAVPFNQNSKGFAISEGSGVIILEREEDAQKRDIEILGEIENIVSNNDGVHIYSVEESGEQMISALKEVVGGRRPDYINSQALGIQLNDRIEEQCSKRLFNHNVPYTSIKSMIGNPYGAIGILQVISSLISINHGFIPPTIRTNKDGYEEMNIVTETEHQEVNEVAITNHGHGGNNACAYIKRHK
ncbi:beta-ketoacyl-[acyl-carrier-protein] synthase family protein [Peribacillus loiseleuriae]|uniref:Beta-ketoacyl synthase n=1 Tax=Peribacillus loiseleuriae TaxID=1679170 RepID=A0A0K9GUG6_9BACI|nr:beta-ketoacyl synthase N-terminal-like domain-containing protein [Peribacillus loiseleuriae]KMY49887.1 beta-ketoacyl synthase [Peribacillus loiseleuriae]